MSNANTRQSLRIGTRKSPLALAQAEMVKRALMEAHPALREEGAVALMPMSTTGDRLLSGPLAEVGGKGLFTKELEEALLRDEIDLAVHSAKDMQTALPDGLVLACALAREDARDVLIAKNASRVEELGEGAVFGTSSLRRAAQAKLLRPDLSIVHFRGNVQTRLHKLAAAEADATMLAMAGLKRLGLSPLPGVPQPFESFLPAVGQGIIGIECRAEDTCVHALLAPLNHAPSFTALTCERALLAALDGSCRTPIAGYAEADGSRIRLRAMLARADGTECRFAEGEGEASNPAALGLRVAEKLRG